MKIQWANAHSNLQRATGAQVQYFAQEYLGSALKVSRHLHLFWIVINPKWSKAILKFHNIFISVFIFEIWKLKKRTKLRNKECL